MSKTHGRSQENRAISTAQNTRTLAKGYQRQLAKPLDKMEAYAHAAQIAVDEISEISTYEAFKAHNYLQASAGIEAACGNGSSSAESVTYFAKRRAVTLERIGAAGELGCVQVLSEQQRVPEYLNNQSVLDELRSFLSG